MNTFEYLLPVGFVVILFIVLGINIFIYKWIVHRAIKLYIKPKFIQQGYTIESKKYPGIFSTGAFKNESLFNIFIDGLPYHYTYVDVSLINKDGTKKKTTAQISTLFTSIRDIKYRDYKI